MLANERRAVLPLGEIAVPDDVPEEGDVVGHALDDIFWTRTTHANAPNEAATAATATAAEAAATATAAAETRAEAGTAAGIIISTWRQRGQPGPLLRKRPHHKTAGKTKTKKMSGKKTSDNHPHT